MCTWRQQGQCKYTCSQSGGWRLCTLYGDWTTTTTTMSLAWILWQSVVLDLGATRAWFYFSSTWRYVGCRMYAKFTAAAMNNSPLCEQLDVLERNMADLFQRRRHGHCIQDVFLLVGVVCPSMEEVVPLPHVHRHPLLHAMHACGRFVWLHLDGGHVACESWDLWCLKHRVLARQQLTQRDMDAQLNLVRPRRMRQHGLTRRDLQTCCPRRTTSLYKGATTTGNLSLWL